MEWNVSHQRMITPVYELHFGVSRYSLFQFFVNECIDASIQRGNISGVFAFSLSIKNVKIEINVASSNKSMLLLVTSRVQNVEMTVRNIGFDEFVLCRNSLAALFCLFFVPDHLKPPPNGNHG